MIISNDPMQCQAGRPTLLSLSSSAFARGPVQAQAKRRRPRTINEFTMMRVLFAALACLATADAATRVAVIEVGKSGVVRRTNAVNPQTSVQGVASFWSALHGHRKLQHAGMTVVPDLFSRPDDGVVVSLTNVDLDNMPTISGLMTSEGDNGVVGHMEVPGSQSAALMKRVDTVEQVEPSSLVSTAQKHASEPGFSGLSMKVSNENSNDVDSKVGQLVEAMRLHASESSKTVVLHLIVEEEEGAARRRKLARRLNEDEGEDENRDEEGNSNEENNENEEQEGDEDEGDNGNDQQQSGYYGYGYFNAYGEWVSRRLLGDLFRLFGTLYLILIPLNTQHRLHHTSQCFKSNISTLSCGLPLVCLLSFSMLSIS